jgi:hypothetical protein
MRIAIGFINDLPLFRSRQTPALLPDKQDYPKNGRFRLRSPAITLRDKSLIRSRQALLT